MQYFVYILYSEKLDRYYIGSTGNPEDRLRKHNRSKMDLLQRETWKLVYKEIYATKTNALLREKQLKNWKNRERIESLIRRRLAGSEHPD